MEVKFIETMAQITADLEKREEEESIPRGSVVIAVESMEKLLDAIMADMMTLEIKE